MATSSDRLVWIDCEMTGLDLEVDELVEIAVVITDFDLNVLDPGLSIVIKPDASALENMSEFVREMHTTSGLIEEIPNGKSLAEAEYEDLESTIEAIVGCRYSIEDRLTLDVTVQRDGEVVARTWALNEASVEKAARERMIEVVVEVDGRPLSRWGCDGVVCATPTGSTAYNFSAGGPIVWPWVEALLMVPISAHALFARPLVVAPSSVLAVEVLARTDGYGVLWADGRRAFDLPPGARIEVRRCDTPVRLVRLHEAPFTDRLVAKFGLPVEGWRGSTERRRRPPGSTDA